MNDWETVRIDQVGKIVTGSTPSPAIVQYWDGEVPFITPTDINESVYVYSTERRLTKLGTSFSRLIPANSVMVVCIGSTIGKTACPLVESVTNQQINTVIPCDLTNPRFLYYTLLRLADSIKQIAGVTAIPIINKTAFSLIEFKLPPLPQQRKIAKILTTVDNLIEKTEQLIAKYQSIKQGMMHDLFTRGIDANGKLRPPQSEAPELYKQSELGWIPKEWEGTTLGAISKFDSGYAFANHELAEHGWKIVRITNLHRVNFPYWRYDGVPKHSWIVKKGDLLFSWAGVASSIDAYLYVGEDALLNQHIYNIRVESLAFQRFVFHWLQFVLPQLRTEIEGGAGQLHLTKSKIEEIAVPMPSELEMSDLLRRMESIVKQINSESLQLEKLQQLKTALMQDLLTGKVQVAPDQEDKELTHA
jgi:type I restriction enzyme S subunit